MYANYYNVSKHLPLKYEPNPRWGTFPMLIQLDPFYELYI